MALDTPTTLQAQPPEPAKLYLISGTETVFAQLQRTANSLANNPAQDLKLVFGVVGSTAADGQTSAQPVAPGNVQVSESSGIARGDAAFDLPHKIFDAGHSAVKPDISLSRGVEDVAAHLFLKTRRELVLGDSHAMTCIAGNSSSFNLILDTKPQAAGAKADQVAAASKGQEAGADESFGRFTFSLTGIARDLKIQGNEVYKHSLFNAGDTASVPSNDLAIPSVVSVDLAYGSLTFINSEKIVRLEYLSDVVGGPGYRSPGDAVYSNFSVYTKEKFFPNMIPLPVNAAVSVQDKDGNVALDAGGQPIAGVPVVNLEPIIFPGAVQGDMHFSMYDGINSFDYRKGIGHVNAEWMEGTSKSMNRGSEAHRITYARAMQSTVIFSPTSYECIYSVFHSYNFVRAVNGNTYVYTNHLGNDWVGRKVETNLAMYEIKTEQSKVWSNRIGNLIREISGVDAKVLDVALYQHEIREIKSLYANCSPTQKNESAATVVEDVSTRASTFSSLNTTGGVHTQSGKRFHT